MAKKAAKKYGLKVTKVVKLGGDVTATEPTSIGGTADTKQLSKAQISDQVQQETTKERKIVDQEIAHQQAKLEAGCQYAKQQLAAGGNPAQHAKALNQALKTCQKSREIFANEKKKMYAAIQNTAEKTLSKYNIEAPVVVETSAKKIDKETVVQNLDTTMRKIKSLKNGMVSKAAVLCHHMWAKVRGLEAKGDFQGHPEAQKALVDEATHFCRKAKNVVTNEMKVDTAALQAGMGVMKHLRKKSHVASQKAASVTTKEAKEALAYEKYLEARKEKRRKLTEMLKSKKIDEENFHRLQNKAQEMQKARAASRARHKLVAKHLTEEQKALINKTMKTNSHCKSILHNLKSLSHVMDLLDGTIGQFEAMEAEMQLQAMETTSSIEER